MKKKERIFFSFEKEKKQKKALPPLALAGMKHPDHHQSEGKALFSSSLYQKNEGLSTSSSSHFDIRATLTLEALADVDAGRVRSASSGRSVGGESCDRQTIAPASPMSVVVRPTPHAASGRRASLPLNKERTKETFYCVGRGGGVFVPAATDAAKFSFASFLFQKKRRSSSCEAA